MAVMLTTKDNPFDPRRDFEAWYAWDVEKGYNTCAYLARIVVITEGFPQGVQDQDIEHAVDEIVLNNGGLYQKIVIEDAA